MNKIYYNNVEVKFLRKLAKIYSDNGTLYADKFNCNVDDLQQLTHMNCSIENITFMLNTSYSGKCLMATAIKYINKTGDEYFNNSRFEKYLEYRKNNESDCQSEVYYKLIYGDNWELFFNNKKKSESQYDPYYISKRDNISIDEAKENIDKFKKNKATSLENFVKKHGAVDGYEMFKKFQETSKHTEAKYIKQYGEIEGSNKWKEYIKVKTNTSVYTINYWLNQGFSPEESEILRKEFHKNNLSTSSIDYWISKGMSEEEAKNKIDEMIDKKGVLFCHASKQSLYYFLPLYYYLINKNYTISLGIENNKELSIYDKENKKLYYYDFCVKELHLIIEFNGFKFHPNPDKLTKEQWDSWHITNRRIDSNIGVKLTADQVYKHDCEKIQFAKNNGYDVLIIWSDDDKEYNWNKIKKFLKKYKITFYNLEEYKIKYKVNAK